MINWTRPTTFESALTEPEIIHYDWAIPYSGKTASTSFHLTNDSETPFDYEILEEGELVEHITEITNKSGQVKAGGYSDTITIRVNVPPEFSKRSFDLSLTVDDATLEIMAYVEIPIPFRDRGAMRQSSMTAQFEQGIGRASEPIILHRFDPAPQTPPETLIRRYNGVLETGAMPCSRFHPDDALYGYSHAQDVIYASFQSEDEPADESYTQFDTRVHYLNRATLFIPYSYSAQLNREWNLFHPETNVEPAQFKRTVFIFQRHNNWYSIDQIIQYSIGDAASYLMAKAIKLQNARINSPDAYNPFAITYEHESDKILYRFICPVEFDALDSLINSQSS